MIISKAAADQRSGRAGRVADGACFRMWDHIDHKFRDDSDQPEVVREDLSSIILDLATIGILNDDELVMLPWVDPPPTGAVVHAREILSRMGAIECDDDDRWKLLKRGWDL